MIKRVASLVGLKFNVITWKSSKLRANTNANPQEVINQYREMLMFCHHCDFGSTCFKYDELNNDEPSSKQFCMFYAGGMMEYAFYLYELDDNDNDD